MVNEVVERLGRLDVLVNNAGGAPFAEAATASPRFSEKIIQLNLTAALHCAQQANRVMQGQDSGGSIINIASVSGVRPSPGTAAYGAAKAGLINFSGTLAIEWAPKVRVNSIAAGLIRTEQAHLHYGDEEGIARVARNRASEAARHTRRRRGGLPVLRLTPRSVCERGKSGFFTAAEKHPLSLGRQRQSRRVSEWSFHSQKIRTSSDEPRAGSWRSRRRRSVFGAAMETERGYDPATWAQLSEELAWTALTIPEEYGGLGMSYLDLHPLMEEMGRALLCAPFLLDDLSRRQRALARRE